MELAILCYAAAAGALMVGGGVLWAAAQVALLLKDVRTTVLPQVEKTLVDVQANLNRIDTLTKDVDTTVEEANQLVASANRTVRSVESGLETFRNKVAIPSIIVAASLKEGFKAGMRALAARRTARHEAQHRDDDAITVPSRRTDSLDAPAGDLDRLGAAEAARHGAR